MTAKDAERLVRTFYPRACLGVIVERGTGNQYPYVWDGVFTDQRLAPNLSRRKGDAWKDAAEVIQRRRRGD